MRRKSGAILHSEISLDKNNPNPVKNSHNEIGSSCSAFSTLESAARLQLRQTQRGPTWWLESVTPGRGKILYNRQWKFEAQG